MKYRKNKKILNNNDYTSTLIHAFITSRLDNINSLLQGVHLAVTRSPVAIENCDWRPKTILVVAHLASETICYLNTTSVAH